MKIVVFGGAGDVGSQAVADLVMAPSVEQVTIADRDATRAQALADRIGGGAARIAVTAVDADDPGALIDAMVGHDVAASALGPFYRFEAKLVRAAVAAGVDYTSVCDDHSAAAAVLDQFDQPARAARRTIITGLGVSPGITNMVVAQLATELDQVRRIDVHVYQPLAGGGAEAVVRHVMFIMTGQVAGWRGGRAVTLPACGEERTVDFPLVGPVSVWTMGHTEPVTLPRFLPGVDECNFLMGYGPGSRYLVAPARRNLFAHRWVREATVRAVALIERMSPTGERPQGSVRIEVAGVENGAPVHLTAFGTGEMRAATGLSLAAGTLLLGERRVTNRDGGVFAPEGCLPPAEFLAAMRERGIVAYRDLELTRPLLRD